MADTSKPQLIKNIFKNLFTVKRSNETWLNTLRRVIGIIIPMFVVFYFFGPSAGVMAIIGSLTPAGLSNSLPLKIRLKVLLVITLIIPACMGLGAMSTIIPGSLVIIIFLVAFISTFLYHAIFTGPPGPINFIFATALGAFLVGTRNIDPYMVVGITILSAFLSSAISLIDVLIDPLRPSRLAVNSAKEYAQEYIDKIKAKDESGLSNREELARIKSDATRYINRAWSFLKADKDFSYAKGPEYRTIVNKLENIHLQYARTLDTNQALSQDFSFEDVRPGDFGTPSVAYKLKTAISSSSRPFFAGLRIAIACSISTIVVMVLGIGHPYWALLTSGLILHMFPDRLDSVEITASRIVGDFLGLGLFALSIPVLTQSPEAAFLLVIVFLLFNERLSRKNTPLAIASIVPLVLIVASLGHVTADNVDQLMFDRGVETIIGSIVAVLTIMFVAKTAEHQMIKHKIELLFDCLGDLLAHMAVGRISSERARSIRNKVSYELMDASDIMDNAMKEESLESTWKGSARALSELGYSSYWQSFSDSERLRENALKAHDELVILLDTYPLDDKDACPIDPNKLDHIRASLLGSDTDYLKR